MTGSTTMPKTVERRYTTFLVAVTAEPAHGAAADLVYAVMARRPDEALQIVRARSEPGPGIAVVGSLSSRMAKAIRLAVGEMRPI